MNSKKTIKGKRVIVSRKRYNRLKCGNKSFKEMPACKNGFTMIEVLVALFIVAGVFVTILSTFSYHISVFDRKKDELKLVLLAKEKIYEYRIGKLKQLEGEEGGKRYQVITQDAELGMKKVISKAYTKDEEVVLYDYVK